MLYEIEKMISLIARSNEIIRDDRLARVIEECDDSELCESELELVVAATKTDYQKFIDFIKLRETDIS